MTAAQATKWQDELSGMPQRNAGINNGGSLPFTFSAIAVVSELLGLQKVIVSNTIVKQDKFSARFWYDGSFVGNAKEDAAEVAIRALTSPSLSQANTASGIAAEEEKKEPEEEPMPEGAIARVGEEILD